MVTLIAFLVVTYLTVGLAFYGIIMFVYFTSEGQDFVEELEIQVNMPDEERPSKHMRDEITAQAVRKGQSWDDAYFAHKKKFLNPGFALIIIIGWLVVVIMGALKSRK